MTPENQEQLKKCFEFLLNQVAYISNRGMIKNERAKLMFGALKDIENIIKWELLNESPRGNVQGLSERSVSDESLHGHEHSGAAVNQQDSANSANQK